MGIGSHGTWRIRFIFAHGSTRVKAVQVPLRKISFRRLELLARLRPFPSLHVRLVRIVHARFHRVNRSGKLSCASLRKSRKKIRRHERNFLDAPTKSVVIQFQPLKQKMPLLG
jgi:hypothetical protein